MNGEGKVVVMRSSGVYNDGGGWVCRRVYCLMTEGV